MLHIPKGNVYRFGDANRATPVFRDLEWSIKTNESWAVVGTGSGEKSSVFDVGLRPEIWSESLRLMARAHRCSWGTSGYTHLPRRP